MQELRSSEILDKEIQADAQRKIEHILANAEQECKKLLSEVDKRVREAQSEKEKFYEKKLLSKRKNLESSLPLEQQRFEVNFIQSSIIEAINSYLSSLSQEERIEMLLKDYCFSQYNLSPDAKINAYIYGFNLDSAKKLLSKKMGKNLGQCSKTDFGKLVLEEDIGLSKNEGIILETEDKSLRIHLTLVEKISRILDKNRNELAEVLFGQGN